MKGITIISSFLCLGTQPSLEGNKAEQILKRGHIVRGPLSSKTTHCICFHETIRELSVFSLFANSSGKGSQGFQMPRSIFILPSARSRSGKCTEALIPPQFSYRVGNYDDLPFTDGQLVVSRLSSKIIHNTSLYVKNNIAVRFQAYLEDL